MDQVRDGMATATRRTGRLVAAIAAGALVLALAGCGGSDDEVEVRDVDSSGADAGDAPSSDTSSPTRADSESSDDTASSAGDDATETDVDIWQTRANSFSGDTGDEFTLDCPGLDEPFDDATVWGTDTYTDDSGICRAAVHAGLIDFDDGGEVTFRIEDGQDTYEGTTANGVTTKSYGSWGASFVFVD